MTYICKPYVFRIVLFLTLLNPLGLLKSRRKMYTNFFSYISKKYINFCPKIWGLLSSRGPRRWPQWPRPRACPANGSNHAFHVKEMQRVINMRERRLNNW